MSHWECFTFSPIIAKDNLNWWGMEGWTLCSEEHLEVYSILSKKFQTWNWKPEVKSISKLALQEYSKLNIAIVVLCNYQEGHNNFHCQESKNFQIDFHLCPRIEYPLPPHPPLKITYFRFCGPILFHSLSWKFQAWPSSSWTFILTNKKVKRGGFGHQQNLIH